MMNLPHPHNQHPLYWALTSVLGHSQNSLRAFCRTSTSVIARLAIGHSPTPTIRARLLALLRDSIDRSTTLTPAATPRQRAYVRAFYDVLNECFLLEPFAPTHHKGLARSILAAVGSTPVLFSEVAAQIGATKASIRRAGRRLGIIETHSPTGRLLWSLPAPGPTLTPPPLEPQIRPARTPRGAELQDALSIFLARAPDNRAPSKDVIAHLTSQGFCKPAIYRAADDLLIIRETTGFGKTRKSIWSLPHSNSTPATHPDLELE